jgi:hypothetical protein
MQDGLPKFRCDALSVNDFPTADDLSPKGSKAFFEKVISAGKIIYTAPGPSADFNNDGRLDMFLPSWWPERRSMLLQNETPGGNWLQVELEGLKDTNSAGIGARLNVYPAGKLGDSESLIASREMAVGFGYASGQPATAHFGLGKQESVDLEIVLPHNRGKVERKYVEANQRLTIKSSE